MRIFPGPDFIYSAGIRGWPAPLFNAQLRGPALVSPSRCSEGVEGLSLWMLPDWGRGGATGSPGAKLPALPLWQPLGSFKETGRLGDNQTKSPGFWSLQGCLSAPCPQRTP